MAEEKPSRKKIRSPEERSLDPAAREMLVRAAELGLQTAFSRADQMAPCPIGSTGSCCHVCFMALSIGQGRADRRLWRHH